MAKIETDGDQLEKDYWDKFVKDKFPSYEAFWLKRVFTIRREGSFDYKSNVELAKDNKGEYDVDVAQLSYSALRHLIRAWEIFQKLEAEPKSVIRDIYVDQVDLMIEGMTRLVGADDNASELLEKLSKPNRYRPFDRSDSKKARKAWLDNRAKSVVDDIRSYRNALVHNPPPFQIFELNNRACFPRIGTQDKYRDWRNVTDGLESAKNDFDPANRIFGPAWDATIGYIEKELSKYK